MPSGSAKSSSRRASSPPPKSTVAVELVDERLAKGEASGYYFVFAEVEGRTVGLFVLRPDPGHGFQLRPVLDRRRSRLPGPQVRPDPAGGIRTADPPGWRPPLVPRYVQPPAVPADAAPSTSISISTAQPSWKTSPASGDGKVIFVKLV